MRPPPGPGHDPFLAEVDRLLPGLIRSTLHSDLVSYTLTQSLTDYAVLVANVTGPRPQVVVKLAGDRAARPSPFDRTATLHETAADAGVPVPAVLAVDVSRGEWPWRYMIKEYVPGVEWAQIRTQLAPEEMAQAYGEIGHVTARVHSIGFPAFGELSSGGTVEGGADYLSALKARAARRIERADHVGMFIDTLERRAKLFAGTDRPSLCHEDLHGHNMIFRREDGRLRLVALLDFDSAWAGFHESDLARLELWRGMTGPGFWEAYHETRTVDEGYLGRRPIYQLLWCLEYASNSPRHLEDTRQICEQLGIPPVESFD